MYTYFIDIPTIVGTPSTELADQFQRVWTQKLLGMIILLKLLLLLLLLLLLTTTNYYYYYLLLLTTTTNY